ncbi:flagellar hook-length control protein FliK [Scandinavium goeteborgense]|uniref:Flagellar hook-length control protein FliK n=1 Tax=Scandinavium goeteborgense TaxID=1851514 RepID=A0A4R6EKU3_SCAGO|nr:flagellar hook-length control protein FliK [Scandinavium goeteborgense]TDN59426.1 flagellar hook-length control protein FliK [Scandinavium goeteborgense]
MSIDITRLLTGGAEALPKTGELTCGLTGKDFGITLDEKRADLELEMLPFAAELLAQTPINMPVAEGERDGESLKETALPEEMLAALTASDAEDNPQWQLQQLVTRNAAGGTEEVRPEAIKTSTRPSAADIMTAVVSKTTGKAEKPLAVADKPLTTAAVVNGVADKVPVSTPPVSVVDVAPTSDASLAVNVNPVTLPSVARPVISTAPVPVATVSTPPESPEWKHSISQQIVMFSRNGIHNAEIRLHPEELGSLHITLRLHQEQAQVHIVSEHAQVRQAMEQAMPQLRAAMAEAGIQLGQANVSADNPFAGADTHGEQASAEQQAQHDGDEPVTDEQIVPQLLTTTPGNVYGINTFA